MLTIEKVIELLQAEYEKAKKIECVYNPLAWALYKVWKIVDSAGEPKITKKTEEALKKMGRAVHSTEVVRDGE